ncbi:hypothetical protein [Qipengyuania huizhouensis]|jgi:hypothetical protein|nr:hypothetical protein [Qipengyuania huizhouensis]
MPIWFEVIVLMLVAYTLGLTLGWVAWGRASLGDNETTEEEK